MFRDFRKLVKANGHRGWRLEEEEGEIYLSKFDTNFNDDEYRIFARKSEGKLHIIKGIKIKGDGKIRPLSKKHQVMKVALQISDEFNTKSRNVA